MKLNKLQSFLLFLFGIICLFTIKSCYSDYIYSEEQVLNRLTEELEDKHEAYVTFFTFASSLNKIIQWDSVKLNLEKVEYDVNQEININFSCYSGEGGTISYSGGGYGCSISLPDASSDFKDGIEDEIGLSSEQQDSLRNYLTKIDQSDFILYKDGSVIINRYFGTELFDMDKYQIIHIGDKMFLYGNYRVASYGNIFIGKH